MPKTEESEAETIWQGNADKLRIFIFIRSELARMGKRTRDIKSSDYEFLTGEWVKTQVPIHLRITLIVFLIATVRH
jgi:hypothetical protein